MDPITKAFIAQMEQFAKQEKVPIVTFEKGQRKDDVAAEYRKCQRRSKIPQKRRLKIPQ